VPLELSSFVGREKELAEVKRLIENYRLLTLTGPGGAGKTRLALAAASETLGGLRDGARWVRLAPLSDPDLVSQAVAFSALGVRKQPDRPLLDTLIEELLHKELLLIMDSCEHLVGACAALADHLLRACPNLKILATSREAFGRDRRGDLAGTSTYPARFASPAVRRGGARLRGGQALLRASRSCRRLL
jgi:predicted ATPase